MYKLMARPGIAGTVGAMGMERRRIPEESGDGE
jgi:hypothetical protein